ncbi:hypothetical protein JAAARDRAFT_32955 [Jaapia argillacea MUCL 33604]|uniref:Uncharacterized protein n=1 Tax=Jaapia argillacea MUCL 33604 TaxID=933084 RepID=A0A067Q9Y8_9AGAM|nr:hypothetical protein JAAARDRAFT_32955 [Jaapia argillacea MUCL 33604]
MDVKFNHGSQIHVVRACQNDDAHDLLAIAGEHSVQVLQINGSLCISLASFHIGCRLTALAWSPRATSPSSTGEWVLELAAAGADFGLHLLTKTPNTEETVFPFGGGLSGHQGKVNDMSFCGGRSEDSARYVATVSDDKVLMVWDLKPSPSVSPRVASTSASPGTEDPSTPPARHQPTAYPVSFPNPLTSIASHPSTSRDFLVADCRGSIFVTDWRKDPVANEQDRWRHSNVIELIEPRALSDAAAGLPLQWSGSVSWRRDTIDIIGAAYGPRFSIWDTAHLYGGKPYATGVSFLEGCDKFRWCHTFPDYFAISAQSSAKGAVIHVHNVAYPQTQPTVFNIAPRPLRVRDFDFLSAPGIPRLAAAVGREVLVFSIGVD